MAKDKSSFILYSDTLHTVRILSDEQAGRLFKTILEYVNDEDPNPTDPFVVLAFEPIKQQLKRDLKNWEKIIHFKQESGRIGGLKSGESRRTKQNEANEAKRSKGKQTKQTQANEPVSVSVSVNDSVNVTERDKGDFWDDEANKKFSLAHCAEVSLKDDGWVSRNKTNPAELKTFNEYLEKIAETEKTLNDYKKHFANKKLKNPEFFKNATSKTISAIRAIEGS